MSDAPCLDGVRVLDLSRLLPGPFCTLVLSELGAAVDKLEDPRVGDYFRGFPPIVRTAGAGDLSARFAILNRDKRSICLDLKRPAARDALLRLVEDYDVVVESFRPGVLDRLGVGWPALSARNPRVVLCSISGYGQTGPLAARAGHDLNYLAMAGVLGQAAPAGGPPGVFPVQLADLAGGGLYAAVSICAALYAARSTGRGRHLDVSMCEGALAFMLPDLAYADATGAEPRRAGELLTGGVAVYGTYRTRDGRYLSVAPLEPKFFETFQRTIGRPVDFSELTADAATQEKIRAEIQAILETRTRDEWEQIFAGKDACVEPVLSLTETLAHPLHRARGVFGRIAPDPGAAAQQPGDGALTVRAAPAALQPRRRAPRLGEHTVEILTEAGLSPDEIARAIDATETAGPAGP